MRASSRPSSMRDAAPRLRRRRGCVFQGAMFFTWNLAYEEIYTTYNAGPFDATAIANNKRDIADARATGIDGFLLAFINRSDQMNWAINMFEAARQLTLINPTQPPFLLFIASNAGNAGDIS